MKNKLMSLAAAALAVAATGNAQTVIDITGSTAGRSAVHQSILSVLSNETYVYNGSSFNGAGRVLFRGNLGTEPVVVRTAWSGSAAGVRDVAQNNSSVLFINNAAVAAGSLNNGVISTGNGAVGNTANLVADVAEIAFSDVFQSSTIYQSPALDDDFVGIIPFKFYASKDAPADLTNLQPSQSQFLWGNSYIPLAMITGDVADQATFVYATGRDPESGTRITAMAEIGYGVFAAVQQMQPTIASGSVTAVNLWPQGTYAEGNGGYSSGSSVKTAIEANAFANSNGLISYLGSSDWTANGKELSYNGVLYSADNVEEGKYTFWGYLHQMRHPSLSGTTLEFYDDLLGAVQTDTTWLVKVSDMQVSRAADGGLISPKY